MSNITDKIKAFKPRASKLASLMGISTTKSKIFTDTAETYLNSYYEDIIFGKSPELYTPEIRKGKEVENDAIALIRSNTQKFYTKFDPTIAISNDYIEGHPDIANAETGELIEIKCPFKVRKWFRYDIKDIKKAGYQWQVKAYLWMLGLEKGKIAVCGMPTPEHLIFEDIKSSGAFSKQDFLTESEFEEWENAIRNEHNFAVIPEKQRIKWFDIELEEEDKQLMQSRAELAKEYLLKLAGAETLSIAINTATQTSFVNSSNSELLSTPDKIISKYKEFGIELGFSREIVGASVTQYRFLPLKAGVKIEKAKANNADIMALLKTDGVIIETPVPKTNEIGIQVPNEIRTTIKLPAADEQKDLVLSVGQTIDGQDYKLDLATAPHLLVAGATGSGKSVLLKTIIAQLQAKKQQFIILDPKREFEFSEKDHTDIFNELKIAKELIQDRTKTSDKSKVNPHVIILDEMETLLADSKKIEYTIDLERYPPYLTLQGISAKGKMTFKQVKNPAYEEQLKIQRRQPKLGDACRDLIEYIVRLGRSEKVHLICATQNPTVQNISSTIKANCPTRICLRVSSQVNSQVILDTQGGEKLLGNGDILLMSPKENGLIRLQGYLN